MRNTPENRVYFNSNEVFLTSFEIRNHIEISCGEHGSANQLIAEQIFRLAE